MGAIIALGITLAICGLVAMVISAVGAGALTIILPDDEPKWEEGISKQLMSTWRIGVGLFLAGLAFTLAGGLLGLGVIIVHAVLA